MTWNTMTNPPPLPAPPLLPIMPTPPMVLPLPLIPPLLPDTTPTTTTPTATLLLDKRARPSARFPGPGGPLNTPLPAPSSVGLTTLIISPLLIISPQTPQPPLRLNIPLHPGAHHRSILPTAPQTRRIIQNIPRRPPPFPRSPMRKIIIQLPPGITPFPMPSRPSHIEVPISVKQSRIVVVVVVVVIPVATWKMPKVRAPPKDVPVG